MMRNWRLCWLSCLVALGVLCGGGLSYAEGGGLSYAEAVLPKPGTWELGLRSGYIWGLKHHAEMLPYNLRVGYTLFNGQWWFVPAGALELSTEPFISVIHSIRPRNSGSIEMGLGLPVFTYYFDTGTNFAPYVEAGLGVLYTDLRGYD